MIRADEATKGSRETNIRIAAMKAEEEARLALLEKERQTKLIAESKSTLLPRIELEIKKAVEAGNFWCIVRTSRFEEEFVVKAITNFLEGLGYTIYLSQTTMPEPLWTIKVCWPTSTER
jgi:hypothetical protein